MADYIDGRVSASRVCREAAGSRVLTGEAAPDLASTSFSSDDATSVSIAESS
jgi:hypothetical protein